MDDENTMPMLVHLLAIFTGLIGPLILWLVKRGDSDAVDRHGKVVLNLQLTLIIAFVGLSILAGIFVIAGIEAVAVVPILLFWLIGVAVLVLLIRGTIAASKGHDVTYPATIHFLK